MRLWHSCQWKPQDYYNIVLLESFWRSFVHLNPQTFEQRQRHRILRSGCSSSCPCAKQVRRCLKVFLAPTTTIRRHISVMETKPDRRCKWDLNFWRHCSLHFTRPSVCCGTEEVSFHKRDLDGPNCVQTADYTTIEEWRPTRTFDGRKVSTRNSPIPCSIVEGLRSESSADSSHISQPFLPSGKQPSRMGSAESLASLNIAFRRYWDGKSCKAKPSCHDAICSTRKYEP